MDNTNNPHKRQLGFMADHGTVPDDINWGDKEIEGMFANETTKNEVAKYECYFSDSSGFDMLKTNKSAVAVDVNISQFAKDDIS